MVPGPPTSVQLCGEIVLVISLMSTSWMLSAWPGARVPAFVLVAAGRWPSEVGWFSLMLPDGVPVLVPPVIMLRPAIGEAPPVWMFGWLFWLITFIKLAA